MVLIAVIIVGTAFISLPVNAMHVTDGGSSNSGNSNGSGNNNSQGNSGSDTSNSPSNQVGLCYDELGGTILKCNTGKNGDKDSNHDPLNPNECYVMSDPAVGWQELDCSNSVFDNGVTPNAQGIGQSSDQALQQASQCEGQQGISTGCGLIGKYVNHFITFLSVVVGLLVVIGIISGGIMYSSSAGDPQKAAKAKDRITKAIVALVAFIFLWAFLEWLVPGGFLNG